MLQSLNGEGALSPSITSHSWATVKRGIYRRCKSQGTHQNSLTKPDNLGLPSLAPYLIGCPLILYYIIWQVQVHVKSEMSKKSYYLNYHYVLQS